MPGDLVARWLTGWAADDCHARHGGERTEGFAAETENVFEAARAKRERKGCDWVVANDVSGDVMGGSHNHVHLLTAAGTEAWDNAPKEEVARRLVARIAEELDKA